MDMGLLGSLSLISYFILFKCYDSAKLILYDYPDPYLLVFSESSPIEVNLEHVIIWRRPTRVVRNVSDLI